METVGRKKADVGIITFHCADNYGAMLQAYGLKRYLETSGVPADIVPYEPPFMTGRHWWIPYIPIGGPKKCIRWGVTRWRAHRRMGTDFFRLRANMRRFRRTYLVRRGQGRILFAWQMRRLTYRCYIVGSDQIWNPAITCGLRPVYFGAFQNRRKEKVAAYAASLGGKALEERYDAEFSALLAHVDVISLREAAAVPYIGKFRREPIQAVLDPVFLPGKDEWEKIEKPPRREGYILLYATELDRDMIGYARELSENTGLKVVELRTNTGETDKSFLVDYTAGPAEFLGYIHRADYVVTNSFHMAAFSIIYEKRFLAFLHSSFGARIHNILQIHGLESRLCENGRRADMNGTIDWEDVKRRRESCAEESKRFLTDHIRV